MLVFLLLESKGSGFRMLYMNMPAVKLSQISYTIRVAISMTVLRPEDIFVTELTTL